MAQTITGLDFKIREMAFRIRELRQIEGLTTAEMATKTDISEEDYIRCEEGTEDLKKEIQNYVKHKTAPYKYPRIVVFKDELPKTISGKIQRNKL